MARLPHLYFVDHALHTLDQIRIYFYLAHFTESTKTWTVWLARALRSNLWGLLASYEFTIVLIAKDKIQVLVKFRILDSFDGGVSEFLKTILLSRMSRVFKWAIGSTACFQFTYLMFEIEKNRKSNLFILSRNSIPTVYLILFLNRIWITKSLRLYSQ